MALELEVSPAATLETARHSPKFSPPQRAAATMHVARRGYALVTEARKAKGGTTASPNLKDA